MMEAICGMCEYMRSEGASILTTPLGTPLGIQETCTQNLDSASEELLFKDMFGEMGPVGDEINLVDYFRKEQEIFQAGVEAAKARKLTVIELGFEDVTKRLCGSVEKIMKAMGLEMDECQEIEGTTGGLHSSKSYPWHWSGEADELTRRLGNDAADKVRKQLQSSEFEWMLTLKEYI